MSIAIKSKFFYDGLSILQRFVPATEKIKFTEKCYKLEVLLYRSIFTLLILIHNIIISKEQIY